MQRHTGEKPLECDIFNHGVKFCGMSINAIAFADDITIIAKCKTDLQYLIDMAHRYSVKWQFKFNPKKCMVLIYGTDQQRDMEIMLGKDKISISDCEPHLGSVLATTPKLAQDFLHKRIQACQKVCYAIQSLGSKTVPMTPAISDKVYKSVCLPKLCYATEIMDIEPKSLELMENFHVEKAKMFQGLPKNACNTGSLLTMGWPTMEATLDINKLMFIWRILMLPMSSIYKLIMIRRVMEFITMPVDTKKTGPVWNILSRCKKYGLLNVIVDAVQYGKYVMPNEWKRLVKDTVLSNDLKRLKVTSQLFKSLEMLNIQPMQNHTMLTWWTFAKVAPWEINKCRMMARILINTYRMGKEPCSYCSDGSSNSTTHVLFMCEEVKLTREKLWKKLLEACPEQMQMEMGHMPAQARAKFVLNALNGKFITE